MAVNGTARYSVTGPLDWLVGRLVEKREGVGMPTQMEDGWEDRDDEDEGLCLDCQLPHDECECHVGAECGRWRNGVLSGSCSKAGSEECDFECPYSR